jgi:hypothetical protein
VPCQNSLAAADLAFRDRLGCSAVFADQAAENLSALDPGLDIDDVAALAQPGFLLQALVRAVPIIAPGVLGPDTAEMPAERPDHEEVDEANEHERRA